MIAQEGILIKDDAVTSLPEKNDAHEESDDGRMNRMIHDVVLTLHARYIRSTYTYMSLSTNKRPPSCVMYVRVRRDVVYVLRTEVCTPSTQRRERSSMATLFHLARTYPLRISVLPTKWDEFLPSRLITRRMLR
jgi:hypothetical protein